MQNWVKLDLTPSKDYSHCFGCGVSNPIGLKLKFQWQAQTQTAHAEFTPGEDFQGWDGYLHGGITACALDEAMGWVAMFAGYNNVTARMQVRYRQMVPIGKSYTVTCSITRKAKRLIETAAVLADKDGNIYAEATSTQFVVGLREEGPQE
ncbi:MAG: putative thioesterase family protein [Chloroflexi bacterium]|nr:putative thioesterase family protein [Chloroflexota bacterium]